MLLGLLAARGQQIENATHLRLSHSNTEELALIDGAGVEVAGILAITKAAALAYLMFNLFTPPCFAAIGAMNAELGSKKWLFAAIGLQIGVGYSVGFLVFFFGSLFTGAGFGEAVWMPIVGWCVVGVFALTLALLIRKRNKELDAEEAERKAKKAQKEPVKV